MSQRIAYIGCVLPISLGPALDAAGAEVLITGATIHCSVRDLDGDAPPKDAEFTEVVGTTRALARFSIEQTDVWIPGHTYEYDAVAVQPDGVTKIPLGKNSFLAQRLISAEAPHT